MPFILWVSLLLSWEYFPLRVGEFEREGGSPLYLESHSSSKHRFKVLSLPFNFIKKHRDHHYQPTDPCHRVKNGLEGLEVDPQNLMQGGSRDVYDVNSPMDSTALKASFKGSKAPANPSTAPSMDVEKTELKIHEERPRPTRVSNIRIVRSPPVAKPSSLTCLTLAYTGDRVSRSIGMPWPSWAQRIGSLYSIDAEE